MNTTSAIVIFSSFLLCVISVVCGHFGLTSDIFVLDELSAPSAWDVLTYAGAAFVGLITFTIDDMPPLINVFFWFISLIDLYAITRLVRGGG